MTRLIALILSFAVAVVAFALLRGPEPAARSAAPAAASSVARANAYLQKARETEDPSYYARADELLRAALARRPGDHDALVASASLAASRHEFRAALQLARRARAARPGSLAAYPVLVDALVELGRFGAAERQLQRLADRKPGLAAYARVSYLRELHGDLDGAVAVMRRAAAAGGPARESSASVQTLLGGLELRRGRLGAARAAYRAALAIVPAYPPAEEGLARLSAADADLRGATRRWRALAARLPEADHLSGLAEVELAAGRGRVGRRTLAGARPLWRTIGGDHAAERALFEADHGSPRRAVALARRTWRSAPGLHNADVLGWSLTRVGRPAAGLRWARRALALGSVDPLFRFHAGVAAVAVGRERAGRRDLRIALEHGLAAWPWHADAARRMLR